MSSIFDYIRKNTERRSTGPAALEKRSELPVERRSEFRPKPERRSAGISVKRRSVDLQAEYGDNVLDLEDAVIIKPYRGGAALFRMLYYCLRENVSFKMLKIEFAKGRSFYIFPGNVFEKLDISLRGWSQGRTIIIYVEKGSLAVSKEFIEEINVEVKIVKEKGPWGEFKTRKIFANGKQVAPGPSLEWRSSSSSLEQRSNLA